MTDLLTIGDVSLNNRFFLGTAGYPSPEVLQRAVSVGGAEVVTLGLKRQLPAGAAADESTPWWELLRQTGCHLLPNTAGCRTAREAITLAMMAREILGTHWIKVEVVCDDYTLQPDSLELIQAAETLVAEGFEVFPYCTEDLSVCQRLVDVGCRILMPWGAPIGSGQGILHRPALERLRMRFPDTVLVVDAGIGAPSHAALAMEMGYDAVLLNSAVAQAIDPVGMAEAFSLAIRAGRQGFASGIIPAQPFATASTPTGGRPFED